MFTITFQTRVLSLNENAFLKYLNPEAVPDKYFQTVENGMFARLSTYLFWTLENSILANGNWNRGSQRPNVSKWVRKESNGFLHALEE